MGEIWVIGNTSPVQMVASSERPIVALVSTNNLVFLKEWSVWFNGLISSAAPVGVTLTRCSTAGVFSTGTAWSQVRRTGSTVAAGNAIGLTITIGTTSTVFASSGYIARRYVHPQVGYHEKFPSGMEPTLVNGEAVCINVNSATTLDAWGEIVYEE